MVGEGRMVGEGERGRMVGEREDGGRGGGWWERGGRMMLEVRSMGGRWVAQRGPLGSYHNSPSSIDTFNKVSFPIMCVQ